MRIAKIYPHSWIASTAGDSGFAGRRSTKGHHAEHTYTVEYC
jgi:hypothetical protein